MQWVELELRTIFIDNLQKMQLKMWKIFVEAKRRRMRAKIYELRAVQFNTRHYIK